MFRNLLFKTTIKFNVRKKISAINYFMAVTIKPPSRFNIYEKINATGCSFSILSVDKNLLQLWY